LSRTLPKLFLFCALGWAGAIFYLSHIPGVEVPPVLFGMDKLLHAIVFGILGFFTLGALTGTVRPRRIPLPWLAVLLVTAYGVLDEFHQHFVPGRTPDIYDVMADAAGGMLGVWLFRVLIGPRVAMPADRPKPVSPD